MHRNYPPDADWEDMFPFEQSVADAVLEAFDQEGREHALEIGDSLGMTRHQIEDTLEWFGRGAPPSRW